MKDRRSEDSNPMESLNIDPNAFLNCIEIVSNGKSQQTVSPSTGTEDGSTSQSTGFPLPSSFQNVGQSLKYFIFVHADNVPVVKKPLPVPVYVLPVVPPENNSHCNKGISSLSTLPPLPISVQEAESKCELSSQVNFEQIECFHEFEEKSDTVEINLSASDHSEYAALISPAVVSVRNQDLSYTTVIPTLSKPAIETASSILSNSETINSSTSLTKGDNESNSAILPNNTSSGSAIFKTDSSCSAFSQTVDNQSFEERLLERDALLPQKASRRKKFKVITCDKCKAIFKSPLQYYSHRNIHMQNGEKMIFICAQCGKHLNDSCSLKIHELKDHGEVRLFPCPYCNHSCKNNFELDCHIRNIHKGEKKFKCKICNYKCFRLFDLKRHLNIHFNIKCHVCYFCGHQFSHPSNLIRHLRIHNNVRPHVCKICKKRFSQLTSLIYHEFSHNSGSCSKCKAKFKTAKSLRRHLMRNHKRDIHDGYLKCSSSNNSGIANIRYFSCQVCSERFRFKKALKIHEESAHSSSPLPCKNCLKVFCNIEEFKLHNCSTVKEPDVPASETSKCVNNSQFAIPRKIYECVNCIKQFLSFDESETHLCKVEVPVEPSQKKIFSESDFIKPEISISASKSELLNKDIPIVVYIGQISNDKDHSETEEMISYTGIDSIKDNNAQLSTKKKIRNSKLESVNKAAPFICQMCSKTFTRKWNWSQHIATHDPTLRNYKCNVCSSSFSYRSTYTSHVRRAHSQEGSSERFSCSQCSKTYKLKESLDQHIKRVHKKETHFQCSLCSKGFFSKTEFNYHMTMHRDELPYTCAYCGKGFRHSSNLKRHERSHTGDRPHKCPYCAKAFIQPVTLRTHLKKHENLVDVQKRLKNVEDEKDNVQNVEDVRNNVQNVEDVRNNVQNFEDEKNNVQNIEDVQNNVQNVEDVQNNVQNVPVVR